MGEGDHKSKLSYLRDIYHSGNEQHQNKKAKYNEMHNYGVKSESSPPSTNYQHNEETAISDLTSQRSIITKEPDSVAIRVSLEVNKGEYNLKLKSVPTENATAEHAHTAAVLMSQGDLLRQLGMKLLSKL